MRILQASDRALLAELDSLPATLALYRQLQAAPIPGVDELVPAARTVLLRYQPQAISRSDLEAELKQRAQAVADDQTPAEPGRLVEITVHYNGADLAELAEMLGISTAELVRRHTGQAWQAAFAGFAPGFIYMAGGHECFSSTPRRPSPRTRVPAGSVALAGEFSAVYPTASPGGWQLIGTTEIPMWDLQRTEPAWVQPGFRVQFVDAGRERKHVSLPSAANSGAPSGNPTTGDDGDGPAITFVATGVQTLVQDLGRRGQTRLGISTSGALDRGAMRAANELVGNPPGTPVLENALGGLRLRCHGGAMLAVTGADAPLHLHGANGRSGPLFGHAAIALNNGDELAIGIPRHGLRCYVAVRGGWQVVPVLGSCATDTLAQLGPPPVRPGDRIAVGRSVPAAQLRPPRAVMEPPLLPTADNVVWLDITLGPRHDWLTPAALELLQDQEWRVTPQSSRVGVRLKGTRALARSRHEELPSEATVSGSIQVPASGQPVLFLADHPLTGGYPVVGAVVNEQLDLVAQLPIGCRVRFRVVDPMAPNEGPGDGTP